jgi:hypothetical protein
VLSPAAGGSLVHVFGFTCVWLFTSFTSAKVSPYLPCFTSTKVQTLTQQPQRRGARAAGVGALAAAAVAPSAPPPCPRVPLCEIQLLHRAAGRDGARRRCQARFFFMHAVDTGTGDRGKKKSDTDCVETEVSRRSKSDTDGALVHTSVAF